MRIRDIKIGEWYGMDISGRRGGKNQDGIPGFQKCRVVRVERYLHTRFRNGHSNWGGTIREHRVRIVVRWATPTRYQSKDEVHLTAKEIVATWSDLEKRS